MSSSSKVMVVVKEVVAIARNLAYFKEKVFDIITIHVEHMVGDIREKDSDRKSYLGGPVSRNQKSA